MERSANSPNYWLIRKGLENLDPDDWLKCELFMASGHRTLCFLGRLRGHESYITRQMLKRHQIEVYNSNRQESRVKDVSHVNSHHIHLVERL